jgi:hypothetical protein
MFPHEHLYHFLKESIHLFLGKAFLNEHKHFPRNITIPPWEAQEFPWRTQAFPKEHNHSPLGSTRISLENISISLENTTIFFVKHIHLHKQHKHFLEEHHHSLGEQKSFGKHNYFPHEHMGPCASSKKTQLFLQGLNEHFFHELSIFGHAHVFFSFIVVCTHIRCFT